MYNKLVAELVTGRVGYGPSLYGPSWLWAEFVMGRVCYGPRCPVTIVFWLKHSPADQKVNVACIHLTNV